MADVLVAVQPFAGHVAPVRGAVRALLDAGHTVRVSTGAAYLDAFARLGAEAVVWRRARDFDEHDLSAAFPALGRAGPRGALANIEHVFIRSGAAQAADLLAEHARRPWDAVVTDSLLLGAALAAERTRTPWASVSLTPLSMRSRDLPPPGIPLAPGRGPLGRTRDRALRGVVAAATTGLRRAYRETRAAVELDPRGRRLTEAFFSPYLVAALGVPGLEAPRSDLPDHVHFIGAFPPAVTDGLPTAWSAALDDGRPVVLVTQGTFDIDPDELIRPAIEALADLPVTVLVTTGTAGADVLPFPVPPEILVAGRVPFGAVLPRVAAMVTNGGWGGTLAALASGVPLVIAGDDLDKPTVAAMVARSGAGIDLRTGRPRAADVRRATEAVLANASYRDAAARLATEFAARDASAGLTALVERLIETRAPVRRVGGAWE